MIWLFSYVKFRRKYKIDRMMCEFTHHLYEDNPENPNAAIEYGCALMLCQQYDSALRMFEVVKHKIANAKVIYPFLNTNIEFCRKPLPWSSGAKDHPSGSWWHNFQLIRFGGCRQVVISDETVLAFNSMVRMMNRH